MIGRLNFIGTFAKFDSSINGVNELEAKGFSAGFYKDGSNAYVGYGNNAGFDCKENPCPGRITSNPT